MYRDNWMFLQAFLRAPRIVASVMPSSSFLERRVVAAADPTDADLVVELGAGLGGITRSLLQAMAPESRLLAIESTATFVDRLRRIEDRRLEIVHGCASEIGEQLEKRGYGAVDAVVSGIPFTNLPEGLAGDIVAAVHEILAPGGRFVAYQITDAVADYARPVMGAPEVRHELRNLPPVRVFTWRKNSQHANAAAVGW